jgi:hypothetical protein
MVVLLVIVTFVIAVVIDVIFFNIKENKKEKVLVPQTKPEFFYTPELGITMTDGGELIKDEDKKKLKKEQ